MADALRDAGVEIYYTEEPDPARHYAVNARDFAVNSPEGVVIGRFKYSERRGEQVAGEKQLKKLGYTVLEQVVASAFGDVGAGGLALSQVLVVAHATRG